MLLKLSVKNQSFFFPPLFLFVLIFFQSLMNSYFGPLFSETDLQIMYLDVVAMSNWYRSF